MSKRNPQLLTLSLLAAPLSAMAGPITLKGDGFYLDEEEAQALRREAGDIECSCKISGTCEFVGGITSSQGHSKKECVRKLKRLLHGTKSVFKKGESPEHPDQYCKCEPIAFKKLGG